MSVGPFRFRAEAALDLRRREHDEARRALAQAESALRGAQLALGEAELRGAGARQAWTAERTAPDALARDQWHRSWIDKLDRDQAAAVRMVAERKADAVKAGDARLAAWRRLEALEKLRAKARESWLAALRVEDRKRLDENATMRFVAAARRRQDAVTAQVTEGER